MTSYFVLSMILVSVFIVVAATFSQAWSSAILALISVVILCRVAFRGTMNMVFNVGRLYWIVRDNAKKGDRIICKAFMRGTGEPWLIGEGVQVRFFKYTFHIGICYMVPAENEEQGVLNAMQGRYMEDPPKEIGNWK